MKWIDIKEELPSHRKCVLIYSKDGGVAEGYYNENADIFLVAVVLFSSIASRGLIVFMDILAFSIPSTYLIDI